MRAMREVPSALERREELAERLEGHQVAFFLDYDGTLAPIVPNPEDARMSEAMRATLMALARRYPVALVSGRDVAVLEGFAPLEGVYYAGSHGFDISGPGGRAWQHEEGKALLPELDAAERELGEALAGLPGARLERKRFSVAVHWRQVEEARVPEVERALDAVLARHPRLRKGGGKKVFEVQPDIDWHKGRAVQWLLRALGLEGERVLPVYVGDDLTDEHAFEALKGKGLGLVVRGEVERETAGDYALEDTEEVRRFLEWMVERSGGAGR
jgi:trehalose 6-phosphate phosphatase